LTERAGSLLKLGDGKKKPRIDPLIYEDIIRGMAMGIDGRDAVRLRARLRQLNEAQDWVVVNLDLERTKRMGEKREIWKRAETDLQSVGQDTGGIFRAPEDLDGMLKLATEIAKAIDSQYVVTYMPKKPFRRLEDNESRKVRVSTYCEGVEIQSRQKIVLTP
jgi:hypothetical protein